MIHSPATHAKMNALPAHRLLAGQTHSTKRYRIYFVDVNAVGAGNGTSWADAYTDIQSAVNAASAATGGEVWVAAGVYTGSGNYVVTGKRNVLLLGGFDGTETARGQRNPVANETIIDGANERTCLYYEDKGAAGFAISGFTLTRGKAAASGIYGAAIFGDECDCFSIVDCKITDCEIPTTGNYALGIVAIIGETYDPPSPFYKVCSLERCIITGCTSESGTASVACVYLEKAKGALFMNCLLHDNALMACYFSNCTAWTCRNNTIVNNAYGGAGTTYGGIYASGGTFFKDHDGLIVWGNTPCNAYSPPYDFGPPTGVISGAFIQFVHSIVEEDAYSSYFTPPEPSHDDPLFTNEGTQDYTLSADSPAIDRGIHSDTGIWLRAPDGYRKDLVKNPRVSPLPLSSASFVRYDAGCYEYQGA